MRKIPVATAALLRRLDAVLIMIGSVGCPNLPAVAQAGYRPSWPPRLWEEESPLTPTEERAWADLVSRLGGRNMS